MATVKQNTSHTGPEFPHEDALKLCASTPAVNGWRRAPGTGTGKVLTAITTRDHWFCCPDSGTPYPQSAGIRADLHLLPATKKDHWRATLHAQAADGTDIVCWLAWPNYVTI